MLKQFLANFVVLVTVSLLLPNVIQAAPTIYTYPDPPIDSITTQIIVSGCPASSTADISWQKEDGNQVTINDISINNRGVGYTTHSPGYSRDENDNGSVKSYSLTATCSDGSTATTSFTPIAQLPSSGGFTIEKDSTSGDFVCRGGATRFNSYRFTDQATCETNLTRLKQTAGNVWSVNTQQDGCFATEIKPPIQTSGQHATKEACLQSIAQSQSWYLIDNGGILGPTCQESPATGTAYPSFDACKAAIDDAFVFYIQPATNPRDRAICVQVKKAEAPTGQDSYPTKDACTKAISELAGWNMNDLGSVVSNGKACYTTLRGAFKTEQACINAFCEKAEADGGLAETLFNEYCEEQVSPVPSEPPPPPPCAVEITNQGCTRINSAIGGISTEEGAFIKRIFSVLLSISGGIALLIIVLSGYKFLTSQGNPEKVKEAQERITSAIVGLIFLIFSIVVLEVIGVDILQIPGLNR
jgi:hypothetical protein